MRLHGRNGLVYLSVHNGDQASPLAYLNSWSVAFTRDLFDVTAITDTQRKWAVGVRDVTGSFTGFMDDATSQTYIAAVDGLPRNMYLYPDAANMGQYFSGGVLPDLAVTGATAAPVGITVNWAAELTVGRTQSFGGTYLATYLGSYT
jgi:hypothetical protein